MPDNMFEDPSASGSGSGGGTQRLASVLVADICGFSSLAERDEAVALRVVSRVKTLLQSISTEHNGRLFHEAADGFFYEFESANRSMAAARKMLENVAQDRELQDLHAVNIRIGLHLGDVQVQSNGNLLGHGVNIAARLQQSAAPGTILASKNLIEALSQKGDGVGTRRKLSLKNLKRPVVAFNIRREHNWRSRIKDFTAAPNMRSWLAALVGLAALAVSGYVFATSQDPVGPPIDRAAVQASLNPLIEANRPVDDMVSALIRTNDFEAAILDLRAQYSRTKANLSRRNSLNLLHQIAGLAVNRDMEIAEEIYLEILKLDPNDAEALLQMSKIYRRRDYDDMALASLQKGLGRNDLTERERLRLEIESGIVERFTLMMASRGPGVDPLSASDARFDALADAAEQAGFDDIAYQARFNKIRLQFFAVAMPSTEATFEDAVAARTSALIDNLDDVFDEQFERGYLYDVSESLATLSTMRNSIGEYESSRDTLLQAMEIEQTLQRPASLLMVYANLGYVYAMWASDDPDLQTQRLETAEDYVAKVRQLAEDENLNSREFYNWYIESIVENKRGNQTLSCSLFEKAIGAWPEKFITEPQKQAMADELGCVI